MKPTVWFVVAAFALALTREAGADSLEGTGDLFSGWAKFSADSPPMVALINTQNPAELREQVQKLGGPTDLLRRKVGPDNTMMPHGLRKVLQLRDRIEELSGLPCLLLHYTQLMRNDLEKLNVKAIVFTAWKPRDDKEHEKEMMEMVRLTQKPFIGFCGGHHFIYMAYGGKPGVMLKLKAGE